MTGNQKHSWLYRNSLGVVMITLTIIFLAAQAYTGWHEHNEELLEKGAVALPFAEYLHSGHFIQATFENWESEFLQMALYVMLTIFLRQKGSSESKKLDGKEEVDREPQPGPDAPWPVRKGGFWLKLYSYSLTIVLFLLFLISFTLHFYGSLRDTNAQNAMQGKPLESWSEYILGPRFWFESFQNWQSEFLSVATIVLLTIFLRQKGSPESKPVDAPHSETGGG